MDFVRQGFKPMMSSLFAWSKSYRERLTGTAAKGD